jgi:hypothetical protein
MHLSSAHGAQDDQAIATAMPDERAFPADLRQALAGDDTQSSARVLK